MAPKSGRGRKEPEKVRLQFKQQLTAKGLAASELLKRLKALHQELADIDQDLIDPSSLDTVAKELISHSLLLHKEKGVKAYLGCCLVDILRLYAPEAPYTEAELKDLFQFLFRQLKHLTIPSEPHFSEYSYILESLSDVKSIVIVCDLDGGDELMAELFKQCFDVVSSQSPKNVQLSIIDILSQLLDEPQQLSPEVVDTLLAQFLPKNVKSNPASYLLAVEVCRGSADKLQRYVCQYFAEVITSTIDGAKDSDDDDDDGTSSEAGGGAGKRGKAAAAEQLPASFIVAHSLIKQVNRSVPTLLLNVIPQLEEELRTDKPAYRKLATECLGAMAGEKVGQGDLALKYPSAWKALLGRAKDRFPAVRIALVESLPKIWTEHPELGPDVEAAMTLLLCDLHDKVRIAACTAFQGLDYETTSTHVSEKILRVLGERCMDTKPAVRTIAFNTLGHLYELAFPEILDREEHAISHYAWIPGAFLEGIKLGQPAILNLIGTKMLEYIVPPPKKDDEEAQWVDRLLIVLQHLGDSAATGLLSLSGLRDRRPGPFDGFLNACEANNGGIIDKDETLIKGQLKACMKAIAGRFAAVDQQKIQEDLAKFAKANEKQLYKVIRTLLDQQLDLKQQLKLWKDCTKRLEGISSSVADTVLQCLRHYAYLIINRSSISTLILRVRLPAGAGEALSKAAVKVLRYVSKQRPALYKSHVAELVKSLGDGSSEDLVSVTLHALSRLAKVDRTFQPDKKLAERAKHFAKTGTARQAKLSATIVALDTARPGGADDLVDFLAESLPDADDEELVRRLAPLNRLARYAPDSFENKSEQITTSVLEVLMRGPVPGEVLNDDKTRWVQDEELDDLTKARILAIKVLTSRCIAYAGTDSAANASLPVFQLLWPLLQTHDENSRYSPPVASRLRLVAGLSILKLATLDSFLPEICKKFDVLARTAQDPCYEVRFAFVEKLIIYLRSGAIKSARFNMILFLVAHDPETEILASVENFIRNRIGRIAVPTRQSSWEHPFIRLIHLLAHHPDFSGDETDADDINFMVTYLEMFVRLVVTKDNIPFIYHIVVKLKAMSDAESPEFDKKLYILSELSQYVLNRAAATGQWAIPTLPQQIPMPGDIFKPLSPAKAKEVVKTNYLSAEILALIEAMGKAARSKVKATPKVKSETTPRKRKSPMPKTNGKKPRGRPRGPGKKWDSASEDEPSDVDSDSDSDDDEKKPAAKKAKAEAPPPVSKRAALARGSAAKGKLAPPEKEKAKTRGVIKKLGQPRAMELKDKAEISDLEDDDDDEEDGMEVDA